MLPHFKKSPQEDNYIVVIQFNTILCQKSSQEDSYIVVIRFITILCQKIFTGRQLYSGSSFDWRQKAKVKAIFVVKLKKLLLTTEPRLQSSLFVIL